MATLKATMDAVDPRLWFVFIAFVVFMIVSSVKKFLPKVWDMVPSRFQALPATIIGALLSATAGQHVMDVVLGAASGAISGVTAVGGFHFLDRLKSPDAAPQPADKP